MRRFVLLLMMALLPLQFMQAAWGAACHPDGNAAAREPVAIHAHAGHVHGGLPHHHGTAQHGPGHDGHPPDGVGHDARASATHAVDGASEAPAPGAVFPGHGDHAAGHHLDGPDCCHASASLPSRPFGVTAQPAPRVMAPAPQASLRSPDPRGLFRPPRTGLA